MHVLNEIAEALANSEKPVVKQVYNHDDTKLIAIGLRKGVELSEHVAPGKAKLMVIQGEVDFNTDTRSFRLAQFDSFDIPEDVAHSVIGVYDAIFLLLTKTTSLSTT
jgi:quercetin dioxygenase-like cupin family protein